VVGIPIAIEASIFQIPAGILSLSKPVLSYGTEVFWLYFGAFSGEKKTLSLTKLQNEMRTRI
jgi:hypothetical protein